MTIRRRVLVIGLDCAPPALVFDRYRPRMPNVARLMDEGTWGPLRSTIPPITVPAWTCMVSGRDPGELGLYGFRNRQPRRYDLAFPTSRDVRVKRVWDWLGEAGKRVAALFVPLTWPPSPVRGQMASCFLTPGADEAWSFPRGLKAELEAQHGAYVPDVPDFRSDDPERVLEGLYAMGRQHFAMARDVWAQKDPDFLMMVEMGPDRLHHALWDRMDPAHPAHDPADPLAGEGERYYAFLDEEIGRFLELANAHTTVLLVSDHGARAMEGGVRINEWLRREGWLVLKGEPETPTALHPEMVDWSRTRAWGEGGYYARIFLNVAGREPEGTVPAGAREAERDRLAAALEAMVGPNGQPLGNVAHRPERIYRETRGTAPDLLAFFGDLRYRSLGTVHPATDAEVEVFTTENDTGPDTCNHDWDGIFVMSGGGAPARGRVEGLSIYDVCHTVLGLLDVEGPAGLLGTDRSR